MQLPKLMLQSSPLLLSFLIGLSLSGCASPPNVPICVDFTVYGICVNTIDQAQTKIVEPEWDEIKSTGLILPANSAAKIKSYMLKSCNRLDSCHAQVTGVTDQLDSLQADRTHRKID